ncbi:hypothetical protein [Aliivibrio logei]|nr:hypothetical protein [Aliivibrio logei]
MTVSAGAYAAPSTTTVVWSGIVPGTVANDNIVITGVSGSLASLTGSITPNTDGTFLSDTVTLESHVNDGTAAVPVVGILDATTNWTLADASVTFDGKANAAQVIEVSLNGVVAPIATVVPLTSSLTAEIAQTVALDEAEVSGTTVQASITLMADNV